ncbi:MAG: hypothetical protein RLZZ136_1579 [Pseudomonadota bacterium]
MSESRLPAHLEVSGLIRLVSAQGGFAAVLAKGEPDAGTIIVVTSCNGKDYRAYERMPQADGSRGWSAVRQGGDDDDRTFSAYLARRRDQDSDLWIVELDIADGERFIGLPPPIG